MATRRRKESHPHMRHSTNQTTTVTSSTDSLRFGWGNWFINLCGQNVIMTLIIVTAFVFMGLLLIRSIDTPIHAIQEQTVLQSGEHKIISNDVHEMRSIAKSEHEAILETQERIADSLEEQVFYLSKTEKERARYKIEMPPSLHRKLLQRGRDNRE
jgi:hypothetical protein